MTDCIFTFQDPVNGEAPGKFTLPPDRTIDLENMIPADRELIGKWFPVDQTDCAKFMKVILAGVKKVNFWIGISRPPGEVLQHWQNGHPWLPVKLTIRQKMDGDFHTMIVTEEDALPLTALTLGGEAHKLALPPLNTPLKLFHARPAWKLAERTEKNIENIQGAIKAKNLSLDGSTAYRFEKMQVSELKAIFELLVERLKAAAPGLESNNFAPSPGCDGLCGAWYVVDVEANDPVFPGEKGSKTYRLTVRIPVGLVQPAGDNDFTPVLAPFTQTDKARVYTRGMDFRFIGFEKIVTDEQFLSSELWLKKVFMTTPVSKARREFIKNMSMEKLKKPADQLKLENIGDWWYPENDRCTEAARKIASSILGDDPLAVFTPGGVHLLENKQQIGAWSAKNNLLQMVWQPPSWPNTISWLDEPISRIATTGNTTRPANVWKPGIPQLSEQVLWPGGREALEDEVENLGDARDCSNQLISALASDQKGNAQNQGEWNRKVAITIRQFRDKKQDRFSLINELWNILTTTYDFNTPLSGMYEPSVEDDHNYLAKVSKKLRPVPTAWRPAGFDAARSIKPKEFDNYYDKIRNDPSTSGIWRKLGVGFRVEGNWSDSDSTINRLKKNGMTQWRENPELMAERSGFSIVGTQLEKELDKARFWNGNHDILNQTAVCVSRNFFGATAFPERWTKGEYTLFALDCYDLRGCDTEQKQLAIYQTEKRMRWWRPGEKAYQNIPWDHIIGWVKITRQGLPSGTGWKFSIDPGSNWTFNDDWRFNSNSTNIVQKMTYIIDELTAWRDTFTVPEDFDFVISP
jgi:hypothetical protein